MRYLVKVTPDGKKFNEAVREGTAGSRMGRILEATRPEAAYFTEIGGERCFHFVVDIANPAEVPVIAEPWFLAFDSKVEFHVCISADELGKANLEELGKKWR